MRVLGGRTDAVLYGGVIEVCSIASGQCRTLNSPCTFVTVTRSGVTTPKQVGKNDWSFEFDLPRRRPPQRQRAAGQFAAGGVGRSRRR